jgi:hypothetical protein
MGMKFFLVSAATSEGLTRLDLEVDDILNVVSQLYELQIKDRAATTVAEATVED